MSDLNTENTEGYEPIDILDEDTGEVVGTSRMMADPNEDEETEIEVEESEAIEGEETEIEVEESETTEGEETEIEVEESEVVTEEDVDLMLDDENVFTLDDFIVDEDGNLTLSEEQLAALMGNSEEEMISYEPVEMSTTFLGISIIQFIVSIVLMTIVLQQTKSSSGMMTSEPAGASGSYWSQNKGRSQESQLSKMTIFLAVLFFVLTLALGFLK
ncbi:MAG: preprotein translocase subunit SecG [bacterium]